RADEWKPEAPPEEGARLLHEGRSHGGAVAWHGRIEGPAASLRIAGVDGWPGVLDLRHEHRHVVLADHRMQIRAGQLGLLGAVGHPDVRLDEILRDDE